MKFTIKNPGGSIITLLRKANYSSVKNSFIKPLGKAGFPRFHAYITQEKDNLIFNLHLDQKKPVYKGTSAHSGEYNSPIVEQEAERIKQILA